MRKPVRCATAGVKCFELWVRSQSGLPAMADNKTGTSAWGLIPARTHQKWAFPAANPFPHRLLHNYYSHSPASAGIVSLRLIQLF